MKLPFSVALLAISVHLSSACKPLWNNECTVDGDCCSNFCDKQDSWKTGVCKVKSEVCQANYYNKCTSGSDCCSKYCDRGPTDDWKFGVCLDDPAGNSTGCKEANFNKCTKNTDCCSENCDKGPNGDWKYGVCKGDPVDNSAGCKPLFFNKCTKSKDCCSENCDKGPNGDWAFGVCKEAVKNSPVACNELYYNKCTKDSECCSENCDKGPNGDWAFGVCKEKVVQFNNLAGNGTCHDIWFNGCTNSSKCCSGYCYFGEENTWEFGVCKWPDIHTEKIVLAKPDETDECKPLMYEGCTIDADCCSGYCYRGVNSEQAQGTCKTIEAVIRYQMPPMETSSCTRQIDETCFAAGQCCSGVCFVPSGSTMGRCKTSEYNFVISSDGSEKATNPSNTTCIALFSSGCAQNQDCCDQGEAYCDLGPDGNWKVGACQPYTFTVQTVNNKTSVCFEDWYEYCKSDADCCSGLCHRDLTWPPEFGACFPKKSPTSARQTRRSKRSIANDYLMFCYIGTWANYKPDGGRFTFEDIDPSLCTHLVYGFAKLEDNEIKPFDPWLDLPANETGGGLDAYRRFNDLKKTSPHLKTIIAIGGWLEGSEKYSKMAATSAGREAFARSVVRFLEKYDFSGIELNWEYPGTRNGSAADFENYAQLIAALSRRIRSHGYSLSLAVSANPRTVESGYDVAAIHPYVDFISVMGYDYHGAFDSSTGHNAPLFARPDDADKTFNVYYGVQYWLEKGAPKNKLLLGMPLYGRAVTLADAKQNGLGAPIKGPGKPGMYSGEPGSLYFREICQMAKEDGWETRWDATSMVPYMVKGDQWVSFDNALSLKYKALYAQQQGLAGVMVWALESDDFGNICGLGKNPLLSAILDVMDHPIDLNQIAESAVEGKPCSMTGIDAIPVLAQFKSLFQAINGDTKCAQKTQERFAQAAPAAPNASPVQAIGSKEEEAKRTQLMFLKHWAEQADGTPVIGHMKTAVHFGTGASKREKKQIATTSPRPLATLAGGMAGTMLCGPGCAVTFGANAGTAYDATMTAVDSVAKGTFTAYGNINSIPKVVKGEASPGEFFGSMVGMASDGPGGRAGGVAFLKKRHIEKMNRMSALREECKWPASESDSCTSIVDNEPRKVELDSEANPVKEYIVRRLPNRAERVERISAYIQPHHLKPGHARMRIPESGTTSTKYFRKYLDATKNDERGHLVGEFAGGLPESYNLVPMYSTANHKANVKMVLARTVEMKIQDHLKSTKGNVKWDVTVKYPNEQTGRPSQFYYAAVFESPSGQVAEVLSGAIRNGPLD